MKNSLFYKNILYFLDDNLRKIAIFLIIFISFFFILFYSLFINLTIENFFFSVLFLFCICISTIFPILLYLKVTDPELRSCFKFIRKLNFTYNDKYWDDRKKPLKHLIGVEVGVFRGENAEIILKHLNIEKLYLVDPWTEYIDEVSNEKLKGKKYESYFKEVKKKFSTNDKVEIIKNFSVDASKKFEDGFFDFVYLDGDHSYESVLQDLNNWYPKLKQFGVMCGDDYGHPSGVGVIRAITEFSKNKNVIIHYGEDNQFWFVKV